MSIDPSSDPSRGQLIHSFIHSFMHLFIHSSIDSPTDTQSIGIDPKSYHPTPFPTYPVPPCSYVYFNAAMDHASGFERTAMIGQNAKDHFPVHFGRYFDDDRQASVKRGAGGDAA
jgi:hypothetical protein